MLENCSICPFNCKVNRSNNQAGKCGIGNEVLISKAMIHMWEEPCISGQHGSFAIFFTGCNLKCAFCQNYKISTQNKGEKVTIDELADLMIDGQTGGADNINLVSPTPYIPMIIEAIKIAKSKGLNTPIIYNSNGYENIESIKKLEGLIDIYLPDLKYYQDQIAIKYSNAPDYFSHATKAILEMYKQVGVPEFNKNGLIKRGLIIRHLVLPSNRYNSKKVLQWIRENLPLEVYVSLMAQYIPMHKASEYKEINRRIRKKEYDEVISYFFNIGLENGFIQELESAETNFIPEF